MNNYERIKSMSIEEMAEFLSQQSSACQGICEYCNEITQSYCNWGDDANVFGIKRWLESEGENEYS